VSSPNGPGEVRALYGDPRPYMRDDGRVSPLWETSRIVRVPFPERLPLGWTIEGPPEDVRYASAAAVNRAIEAEVLAVFRLLAKEGLWRHLRTYDGGFVWRPQRGSSSILSMHAFGGALDFNANTNKLGTPGDMHPAVVQMFEASGWTWGGRWSRPDPMHFQFARGV
jgi:hypothetical protein